MLTRLGPADYRVMPWKNGLGSTTELLIHPPGATLEGGFLWRLSMAEVGASGPFSAFPGVDRTLMLLQGGGMELDHGEHGRQCLEGPLLPVSFSGDWQTQGRLLDGPCRDFNVMTTRGAARHALTVLHAGSGPVPLPEADVVVAFCVRGRVEVGGLALGPLDLLMGEGDNGLAAAGQEGAVLAVVALKRLGATLGA